MEAYPLPDLDTAYRYEHLGGQVAALQEQGFAVAAGMACTIFEIAWYMRSMERLLTDFLDESPVATVLLDRITELRKHQARRYALSGADILHTGDDIGSQRGLIMSLPMWRRWLKPRLAAVIAEARAVRPDMLVFYHSDGDVTPAIPDLIEIGVDILNPVQCECMDPAALKREYGRDLAFWGTIGTQTTLPFGAPEDVRNEVRVRMQTVGVGGGLLLGPTHILEPEVPFENIVALVDAIHEYGWYR
jgi:uroporphyrinogen decarboxylase